MKYIAFYKTAIGRIGIAENRGGISHILFEGSKGLSDYQEKETALIENCHKQLMEYFEGKRTKFDIPLYLEGTEFQKSIWSALQDIPFGETCSYKEVAIKINNEKAVRAVGLANNKNRIPIIIPCHRVVGINGSLTGYAGGLELKQFLIDLEKK